MILTSIRSPILCAVVLALAAAAPGAASGSDVPPEDLYREGMALRFSGDATVARQLLMQACDMGHLGGCVSAGPMWQNGEGGPANPDVAQRMYQQACTLGDQAACTLAMLIEVQGPAPARAAAPSAAATDEAAPSLESCAALYYAVNHERGVTPVIPSPAEVLRMDNIDWLGADMLGGAFWVFSNATVIDWNQRYRALEARSGQSDVVFMLNTVSMQGGPLETQPRNADPAFPLATQAPLSFRATLPSRGDTPPYGRRLTQCDQAHGFAPAFWFGAPEPLTCAAALYMVSTDGPEHAARAIAEARNAVQAHIAAHGGDQLELENRVVAEAQARIQRLQSGAEPVDGVRFDVQMCRREFGVAP